MTNGNLVRLELTDHGRRARVVDRAGEVRPVESLSATERDQVYLSLCLALHSAAAQQGVWLPLVLDDPFVRLDGNGIASLAAVLDGFARQGHQVIVFTGQQAAAERLLSLRRHRARHCWLAHRSTLNALAEMAAAAPPIIETITPRERQKPPARSHAERSQTQSTSRISQPQWKSGEVGSQRRRVIEAKTVPVLILPHEESAVLLAAPPAETELAGVPAAF